MSSPSGWYPDPGGQPSTFRWWDGRSWSAATTTNPAAPPPSQGLVGGSAGQPVQPQTSGYGAGQAYGGQAYGGQAYGAQAYGVRGAQPDAYAQFQQQAARKSGKGWWIGAGAVAIVLVVVVVFAVRALTGSSGPIAGPGPGGQGSQDPCPAENASAQAEPHASDGRVHGGPISYPELGSPWSAPGTDDRVPFGSDVKVQEVPVETNYDGKGNSWVASVLVGRLQAGDGFFTPQQGSQIVVKCILGEFYGNAEVTSDVKKDQKADIDGHDGWLVESHLTFDIKGLQTKGELLIVAIVKVSDTSSGLYYASIPDTTPELVQPAREALQQLAVDS